MKATTSKKRHGSAKAYSRPASRKVARKGLHEKAGRPAQRISRAAPRSNKTSPPAQSVAQITTPVGAKSQPSIELYQKEDCQFSHRVRDHLTRLNLDFVSHSVLDADDAKHQELLTIGGKDQIPFLIDHATGVRLYESDAITRYLDREYGQPGQPSPRTGIDAWTSRAGDWAERFRQRVLTSVNGNAKNIERAKEFRKSVIQAGQDSWETLKGSAKMVRKMVQDRSSRSKKARA